MRKLPCRSPLLLLAALAAPHVAAQTQDTSQNALLKGTFRFRHLAVLAVDARSNPTEIAASYGAIAFDGAGHYTIAGTTVNNTVSGGAGVPLTVSGTYAIGSNGTGYVSNPLNPTDSRWYVYGAVSQGIYAGSSTEAGAEGAILNDIFVAIPVAIAPPSNAGFTSAYQVGLLDFTAGGSAAILNALFELTPNGQGAFGTIGLSGQASNQSGALTQSVTGAAYNFNGDGSATLTIPAPAGVSASNALFAGTKTIFESEDGNYILGWTAAGYDIFFGMKALSGSGSNSAGSGLYFTAALEDSTAGNGTDSYYGSSSYFGDSAGDGTIHQHLDFPGAAAYDFGGADQVMSGQNGGAGPDFSGYKYIFGAGGLAFAAIGTSGNYALQLGLHAASFSGPGVFLNPIGVVNAASYQPVTAGLAPGEVITLFGTGFTMASTSVQGGQAFPLSLGGVSVSINGTPCPLYSVSSTQISAIVPYAVASNTGLGNIQVTNTAATPNGASNVVQMRLTEAQPGAFAQAQDGLGYAAALHAATGVLITPASPAQPGEYISLYLTGLGAVTPSISDGALGPSSQLSIANGYTAGNLAVLFNDYTNGSIGNAGNIQFAGLAPGLAGLYQINVQVPAAGLGSGDKVFIEFVTDAADVDEIEIPYGS